MSCTGQDAHRVASQVPMALRGDVSHWQPKRGCGRWLERRCCEGLQHISGMERDGFEGGWWGAAAGVLQV